MIHEQLLRLLSRKRREESEATLPDFHMVFLIYLQLMGEDW
jgi:hypothetical protein